MTTGLLPIYESEVRYGDVFQWRGGSVYMFVAWDRNDMGKGEGPCWISLSIDSWAAGVPGVKPRGSARGFQAIDKVGAQGWERLP